MSGKNLHFRIHTADFLKEIADNALTLGKMGVLKVPLNVFRTLLLQVGERAAELNDPILNKLMFDMTIYELPSPSDPEYGKLMKRVYAEAEKQEKKERKTKKATT